MDIQISKIEFEDFGLKKKKDGIYLCASFDFINKAGANIYDLSDGKLLVTIEIPDDFFIGNVACILIKGLKCDFGYRLFSDDKEFHDPYAREYDTSLDLCVFRSNANASFFSKDKTLNLKPEDMVIYETNVRAQTMADPVIKKDKGTFKALERKLTYFKSLGVTSLMLMPVYSVLPAKADYRDADNTLKPNLWGFGRGLHFSLKEEYFASFNHEFEFKHFIYALHKEGLEIILMMEFHETDSTVYIMSVLKYYLLNYHIDGFRLIGGGFDFYQIAGYPLFKNTKLFYNNFDFSNCRPSGNIKFKNLICMDEDFLINSRRFLKGDEDCVRPLSFAVRENHKYFSKVRMITDFSGFTLYDLVSYNLKHNEANGEANSDGTDYNFSWNCSVEGETKSRKVKSLRDRQIKNAFLFTFLSQGIPLLRGGDECLNSQNGNNNPYCQDNETGWITKGNHKPARELTEFVKNLIAFRKRHVILHQPKELQMFDYMSVKVPDVSYHSKDAFKLDAYPTSRSFGILYYGDYAKQYTKVKEPSVYIIYNMHWEKETFALPLKAEEGRWKLLYSTDGSTDSSFDEEKATVLPGKFFEAPERSVSVLLLD